MITLVSSKKTQTFQPPVYSWPKMQYENLYVMFSKMTCLSKQSTCFMAKIGFYVSDLQKNL